MPRPSPSPRGRASDVVELETADAVEEGRDAGCEERDEGVVELLAIKDSVGFVADPVCVPTLLAENFTIEEESAVAWLSLALDRLGKLFDTEVAPLPCDVLG